MTIVALVWVSFFAIFLSAICIYVASQLVAHPDNSRFSPFMVVSLFTVTAVLVLAGLALLVSL
jgi:hypothetical protein